MVRPPCACLLEPRFVSAPRCVKELKPRGREPCIVRQFRSHTHLKSCTGRPISGPEPVTRRTARKGMGFGRSDDSARRGVDRTLRVVVFFLGPHCPESKRSAGNGCVGFGPRVVPSWLIQGCCQSFSLKSIRAVVVCSCLLRSACFWHGVLAFGVLVTISQCVPISSTVETAACLTPGRQHPSKDNF